MTDIPATVAAAVQVQYWDGAAWADFGDAMSLGSLKRTRRVGIGPGVGVTAQKWRIVKTGDYDWGDAKFFLGQLYFWAEAEALEEGETGQVRVWSFNFDSDDERYIIVSTPGNFEIFRAGARCGSAYSPYDGEQLRVATRTQKLDTLIAFQVDVPPWRLMRQGFHHEWDSRAAELLEVPRFDYGAVYTNGVNEVQRIIFRDYVDGDTFKITLEGETTASIAYSSVAPASNIEAALQALPSIGPDGISANSVSATEVDVTFEGKVAGYDMGEMAAETITSVDGVVTVATMTQGERPGEPVISDLRGWPACGTFFQQRLLMGGLRSRPQTVIGSRLGSYFNFRIKGGGDNGALDQTIDTASEGFNIKHLAPGERLQVLTSSAELYFDADQILPFTPIKRSKSARGSVAGVAPAEISGSDRPEGVKGGTVFLTAAGDGLARLSYAFEVNNFIGPLLSVDASHLVKGATDFAFSKVRSTDDPDLGVMVTGAGQLTAMSALLEQDVLSFMPWTTQGTALAAGAELAGDIYLAVDRSGVRTLERFDRGRLLDASVAGGAHAATITGLGHLEGLTVCAYADGADQGDFTVEGGAITLPRPVERGHEVGLLFVPRGVTMPGVLQADTRGGSSLHARTGTIDFRLGPTTGLRAGLPGGRKWRVGPVRATPALPDTGPGENPYQGWAKLDGVPGARPDAQVEWVQPRPGPLEIRELVVSVS